MAASFSVVVDDIKAVTEQLSKCYVCGKNERPLLRCGRCKSVTYCGKEHQKVHWTVHKRECDQPSSGFKSTPTRGTKTNGSNERVGLGLGPQGKDMRNIYQDIDFPPSPFVSQSPELRTEADDLQQMAETVVDHMRRKGYCILENFNGDKLADDILQEVRSMYDDGKMKDGELIATATTTMSKRVRSDKMVWVSDSESVHISQHSRRVDILIKYCTRRFEIYDIRGRSPAMVACYPGGGTAYKRHVDNPTGDGRCISTLYYLNKNWDIQEMGGQLRLYPFGNPDFVDVEPIFDRLLLFWSDKRTPHEVIPSFSVRFAVTLWYFDAAERAQATLRYYEQVKNQARHEKKQEPELNDVLRKIDCPTEDKDVKENSNLS